MKNQKCEKPSSEILLLNWHDICIIKGIILLFVSKEIGLLLTNDCKSILFRAFYMTWFYTMNTNEDLKKMFTSFSSNKSMPYLVHYLYILSQRYAPGDQECTQ